MMNLPIMGRSSCVPVTIHHDPPHDLEVAVPIRARFEAEPPIRVRILPPEKIVSIIQTGPAANQGMTDE
jgi:hypothetical protein